MSDIHVCPLSALEQTLITSDARWMISLSGPGKSLARPTQVDGGFLALEFNDISEPREKLVAPDDEHIATLLAFIDAWNCRGNLLIHCWMGISRSTAAAAIALARLGKPTSMDRLANRLRTASPMATPNALMIAIADRQLGFDGAFSRAINSIGRGEDAPEGRPFILDVLE